MSHAVGDYGTVLTYFRMKGSASNELEVFNGTTYWSDVQLFDIIHRHITWRRLGLVPTNTDEDVGYLEFSFGLGEHYWIDHLAITIDGTEDTATVNVAHQTVTFTTQQKTGLTIYAPFFNMNTALAELWEIKAGQRFNLIQVKGGANQVFMEQEYEHCVQRMDFYRNRTAKRFRRKLGW